MKIASLILINLGVIVNLSLSFSLSSLMPINFEIPLAFAHTKKIVKNSSIDLINFVKDRLGHDYRYAIGISKIKNKLGWEPKTSIDIGLKNTLNWYMNE